MKFYTLALRRFEDLEMHIVCTIFLFWLAPCGSENIAFSKKTSQSSSFQNDSEAHGSHLANDGNLEQIANNDVCSHTSYSDPIFWWAVDLEETYTIQSVIIYGRTDCCEHRLANFDILLFNPPTGAWEDYEKQPGKLCYHQMGVAPNILNVTCAENIDGRFLKIVKKSNHSDQNDCLTLCEVQVFGIKYTETEMCPCSCSYKERKKYWAEKTIPNHTIDEWRDILKPVLEQIDKELRINKTNISANRRRKHSAKDNRTSAKRLGILGASFLAIIIGFVIFIDITAIRGQLQTVRPTHYRI